MTDDHLRDLYQEVILDHGKNPRHFGTIDSASHEAHGHNPLCGDQIHLFMKLDENDRVVDVSFDGKGCAISIASASMMSDLIIGKDVADAKKLAKAFYQMAKGETCCSDVAPEDMERLEVMSGVSQFPMRVKCATMAWHTFESAFDEDPEPDEAEK
ncbi:SUF system NifU family Fe-S cluster assembly protein [Thalassospira sp. MA62]|nr:SUF system NifU family Fe-S cluster assembly protein [Thalassospira sp. MA62]